jgi:hypothetical protein
VGHEQCPGSSAGQSLPLPKGQSRVRIPAGARSYTDCMARLTALSLRAVHVVLEQIGAPLPRVRLHRRSGAISMRSRPVLTQIHVASFTTHTRYLRLQASASYYRTGCQQLRYGPRLATRYSSSRIVFRARCCTDRRSAGEMPAGSGSPEIRSPLFNGMLSQSRSASGSSAFGSPLGNCHGSCW